MLVADERHDFTRTYYADLQNIDFGQLVTIYNEMVKEAGSHLRRNSNAEYQIHLDLRYVGQEFTLSVPVTVEQLKKGDRKEVRDAFDALYEHRYAHHSPEEPVEIINVRVAAVGKKPAINFPKLGPSGKAEAARKMKVYFADAGGYVDTPVYDRADLGAGAKFTGPALIQEHGTTTVMYQGDTCEVAPTGELIIKVRGE
jgi:N-methylhydantoinase A